MSRTPRNTDAAAEPPTKSYYASADGWVAGSRVKAGDKVELTERAARYENVSKTAPKRETSSSTAKAGEKAAS